MITVLPRLLRATLSMIWCYSLVHSVTVCCSMLLVPAASTVTSLSGMSRIRALIWRAVRPGYTKPFASKPLPLTSGATPRTMELPITVIVASSADDVTVLGWLPRVWRMWRWRCCGWTASLSASNRLAVGTVIWGCGEGKNDWWDVGLSELTINV